MRRPGSCPSEPIFWRLIRCLHFDPVLLPTGQSYLDRTEIKIAIDIMSYVSCPSCHFYLP